MSYKGVIELCQLRSFFITGYQKEKEEDIYGIKTWI